MKKRAELIALVSVFAASCAPAEVDYSELQSAAEARQRTAGAELAPNNAALSSLLSKPLSADSAARIALLNNRGARAAVEDLGIAQAELVRVRRLPNPTAEAAIRFKGSGESPILELGAMIDLSELLLLATRSGAAGAEVDAAKLAAVGSLLDLSFDARRSFYRYQAAAELVVLRRTVLESLNAGADLATRLRAAGNITELDLATQLAIFEEARFELQRAELEENAARERLNGLMGLWGRGIEWRADSRLPQRPAEELDVTKLEGLAIGRSLELAIAKARFGAAARRKNAAQAAGFLPELKAGVSAERDEDWAIGPAVEIEVPLFYQGQGEIGVAEAQMRKHQNLYTDAAVRIRSVARNAAMRLTAAGGAVTYYQKVLLPLKQKVLDESQLQYNGMLIGLFQLLQAKRDQVQTAAAYVEQLREYWLARTDVEQLLSGRLVEASSSAVPATARSTGPAHDAH